MDFHAANPADPGSDQRTVGGEALIWHDPVRYALWIAAISGFIQAIAVAIGNLYLGRLVTQGPNLIWMIPLALMVALGLVGVILSALRALGLRFLNDAGVTLFPLFFLGIFNSIPFLVPGLDLPAKVLLSAGAAVVIIRTVRRDVPSFRKLVSSTSPALGALLGLVAVGMLAGTPLVETVQQKLLDPPPDGSPNILLLVLDTVRGSDLSTEGYGRPTTPSLEQLATSGVRFANAVSTAPWTLPSHASMFTGRWPHELSADWNTPLDSTFPTLAETLRNYGYRTGGFVANMSYTTRVHGLQRGFLHYEDYGLAPGDFLVAAKLPRDVANSEWARKATHYYDSFGRKTAADLRRDVMRWIGRQGAHPFFAFVNFFDAHEPCIPPAAFDKMFSDERGPPRKLDELQHLLYHAELTGKAKRYSATDARREVEAYDACIASIDAEIGRLLAGMRRVGLLDHTIVVVTADHGEQFGEHGKFVHGNSLYRPLIDVPLIIIAPGMAPRHRVVDRPVSLRDLPATILDLAGYPGAPLPGYSLVKCWTGDVCTPSPALSELKTPEGEVFVSLTTDSLHLIIAADSQPAFRWREDPGELKDNVGDVSPELFRRIEQVLKADTMRSAHKTDGHTGSVAPSSTTSTVRRQRYARGRQKHTTFTGWLVSGD